MNCTIDIEQALQDMSMDGCTVTLGSVQDFGWYGCLENTGLECAPNAILTEDTYGFKDYTVYDTKQELDAAWEILEYDYMLWSGPSEDGSDYVTEGETSEDNCQWFLYGKLEFTGTYQALKAYMETDGYFPNVWFISDHGNHTLING